MLASDLVYQPEENASGGNNNDDDFEDEEEMDFDEDEGDAGDGADFAADLNNDDQDVEGEQQDEAALIARFQIPARVEYRKVLEETVRRIGKATMEKIVGAKKESGSEHFTKAES